MKESFSPYSLIVYTIIFFLSSESTSVYGQYEVKPKTNNLYWIHAGLGRSSLGSLGASAGLGIARVTGSRHISGLDIDIDPTVGFPIEVQLFHKAFRFSAIGLNFYWNINREESFGGLTVGFMFGKLR